MTHAPRTPSRAVRDLDEAATVLHEHGGRLSHQRRQVLEALFAAEGPVSAEHVAQGLARQAGAPGVASTYRILEDLERLGILHHVHLAHGPGLYALTEGTEREYLVCERCGRVSAVEAARLDRIRAEIRTAFGYEASFTHFPIVGLCDACAGEPAAQRHDHEHSHLHSHGGYVHAHPHAHDGEGHRHGH